MECCSFINPSIQTSLETAEKQCRIAVEVNGDYEKALNQTIKNVLLGSAAADHAQKLHTINNPQFYWDIINNGWGKGIQKETQNAMNDFDTEKHTEKSINIIVKKLKEIIDENDEIIDNIIKNYS